MKRLPPRSFLTFWAGESISVVASEMTLVLYPLIITREMAGGAAEVGLVASAGTIPFLAFSFLLGNVLTERSSRRIMLLANGVGCVIVSMVAVLLYFEKIGLWALVAASFAIGTCKLVFRLTSFSYVPDIVPDEHLDRANQLTQGSASVTAIAAPGITGVAYASLSSVAILVADALSFCVSSVGIILSSRSRPSDSPSEPASLRASSRGGLRDVSGFKLLWRDRLLRAITAHAGLFNFAEQVLLVNLAVLVLSIWGVDSSSYGVVLASMGVGSVVGTIVAGALSRKSGVINAFQLAVLPSCCIPLLLVLVVNTRSSHLLVTAGVVFCMGLGGGAGNIFSMGARQRFIPREKLTQTAGAYTNIIFGSMPLGSALGGFAGTVLGVKGGVCLGCALLFSSALPIWRLSQRSVDVESSP